MNQTDVALILVGLYVFVSLVGAHTILFIIRIAVRRSLERWIAQHPHAARFFPGYKGV